MILNKKFRDNDRFPDDFDIEILFKDSFKNCLKILQLTTEDRNVVKRLYRSGIVKELIKDFKLSKDLEIKEDEKQYVNYYLNEVLNPKSLDIEDRIYLILNNIKIEWNMNYQMFFIDYVGDYLMEKLVEKIEERKDYVNALKVISKIVNLDKNLLWRSYEEVNLYRRKKIVEDFKKAFGFLPNMVYKLRKELEEESFKVVHCEGNLADILGIDTERIRDKKIEDLLSDSILEKLKMHIESAIYNGIEEFIINFNDRILRNVIRVERRRLNGKDVVEVLGYANDITELNKSEEKKTKMAYYDSLTGLPNRELFYKKLSELLELEDPNKMLGILFIDVNEFKSINDTLGHYAGDQLLIELGKRLKKSVRSGDVVARLAGDEFTILCTNVKSKDDVKTIVDRILNSISEVPFDLNGQKQPISISIGVSIYPMDGTDVTTLLHNADIAMYKAKNSGRNQYRFFEASMNSEALTKLQIQNDLRKALSRGEFYLEYQLQFDDVKKKIVGVEALIRWSHPEKGYVSPGEFIEVAENSGLIVDMGYWVLEEGCKRIKELVDEGHDELVLAINFSALQFMQRDLVNRVKNILESTGLNPKHLMIEITESTSMNDVEFTINVLKELRDLGVLISIDDFGTGYSSLSYLKKFPITNLKIDRSFVKELSRESDNTQVVKSIIALADSLDLEVVAEGVETREQYEILKELGCRKFQGFLFGKPVSFEMLRKKLKEK